MYYILGDPGYPGPPGLRGESGQKGNSYLPVLYAYTYYVSLSTIVLN